MEFATPQRYLGRLSLRGSPVVSAPLRKSIGPSTSSTVLLRPLNDDQERSTRRSIVELQRRLINNNESNLSTSFVDTSSLAEDQIEDHLKICVKLHTENRISAKNAWQLHVIDALRKVSSVGSANVLQVAGSSLDIGAKVYSLRVDDVHAKGLQLASSMSKNNEKVIAHGQDEEYGADLTMNNRQTKRRKIKKLAHDKRNTIDYEQKTLCKSVQCVESAVFSTKESIEVSAIENLFTHKLSTNPGNHQFMSLSNGKYWTFGLDEILDIESELLDELPEITDYNLCVPFKSFGIGASDPEEEELLLSEATVLPDAVLDDDGVPVAELDGSIVDIFGEDHNDNEDHEEHEEEFQAQIHGDIAHIVDAVPEECRRETDYGYNVLVKTTAGKYIDKIWAGPSHWKVKFNMRSTPRFSGTKMQQAVKYARKTKTPELIDFSISSHPQKQDILKLLGEHSVKRAPPTMKSDRITLPICELDVSIDILNLQQNEVIIKPGIRRAKLNNNTSIQRNYEVQPQNYENNEYCSNHSDHGDFGEPAQDHSFEEDIHHAAQEQLLDENLVDAPETVASTHITYAMQAKKMDMKKLKTAVRNCLALEAEQRQIISFTSTRFSSLFKNLPVLLPSEMRKELTCPLALVALLDLCNEYSLILEQDTNTKDFTIRRAEE